MGRQNTPADAARALPGPENPEGPEPGPEPGPARARRLRVVAGALLIGLTLLYCATFWHRTQDYSAIADGVLANAIGVLGAVVAFGRAALVRHRRVLFTVLGLIQAGHVIAACVQEFHVRGLDPPPDPSWADAGFLSVDVLIVVALVAQAWPQLRAMSQGTLLDFCLGVLSCAGVCSVLILQPALDTQDTAGPGGLTLLAYPVLDLVQLSLIVGIVTLRTGFFEWTWFWLTAGVLTTCSADVVNLYTHSEFGFSPTFHALYTAAVTMMAMPAVHADRHEMRRNPQPVSSNLILRNLFSVVGVLVLVYGCLMPQRLPAYAIVLALATLLTAARRAAVGLSALRSLAQTQRQAYTDELTQLFNRRHFDDQMQRVLTGRSPDAPMAVMVMDLNGFKAINDTFGHHIGDEVLRQMATRVSQELRRGDLAARLGGDEFGVLLPGCDAEGATVVASRVLAAVEQPLTLDGETHHAGGSIGIAVFPGHGIEMATLVRHADDAMYHSKISHRGVTVYDERAHQRNRSTLNVQHALDRHELVVHYQPQYHLLDGTMSGVEALVRWNHPERGLLYPDAFLPFFEKSALMAELTVEVLAVALADRETWTASGRELDLSINLPPTALLNPDLVPEVSRLLGRAGHGAKGVVFEITENAMMFDIERAQRTLAELRALGLELSLDDYGTGYCSLTYLRDLPLHEIKIDRSFVGRLAPGTPDADIVASTLDLAHRRGLRAVAEGVENAEAWELLRDMRCDLAQGYLMSRPVPLADLLALPVRAAHVSASLAAHEVSN
ncbi:bifunctional diguanylate cyclase/phosphodiesterase [Kineosporia sp. J2-2]|uniref:Bifunctional diguanylate cyclase/phosphodiesterase n=1 Tax=Kineosporia corallincola TaxID=2835133 RepID=A0ABS5TKB4_9ACTN|nr:bifunctional diguanylate cyclase/phosphodiesterase [Kineosporia corallincola]MBT0771540.1 bifunctional diguanylate cyclase/phosphodiesterase [Kineosporia corallincola]